MRARVCMALGVRARARVGRGRVRSPTPDVTTMATAASTPLFPLPVSAPLGTLGGGAHVLTERACARTRSAERWAVTRRLGNPSSSLRSPGIGPKWRGGARGGRTWLLGCVKNILR